MTPIDYLVIALYAGGMLAVGRYFATRTKTADEYLLGGRHMSPLMIGLSLFATLASTLTYLAIPGQMVRDGPMVLVQVLSLPLAAVIVGWGLIPFIMCLPVASAYELLESRLGLTGRLIGSGMFIALRLFWMASILYATASQLLVPTLRLSPSWTPWLCVVMGVLTIIYTAEGGLRAVVFTDAAQSLIMFGGAIACIAVITVNLGGFTGWWPSAWEAHWEEPVFWYNPGVRITAVGAFVNMLVWMVCTAGSDQMAIQRYLATRNARAARNSFIINVVANTIMTVLLALVGLAVLGYFQVHPQELPPGSSVEHGTDKLFPHFIEIGLPPGLTGLVIAAILSAAMSSLSSGMNSASATISNDFVLRFRQSPMTQSQQLLLARLISIGVGIVAVLLSTVVGSLASNLLLLCFKVVNLLTAPLFVLFFLALFVPWASPFGAAVASVTAVGVAVQITFVGLFGLNVLWAGLGSLIAGCLAGIIASPLFPTRPRAPDDKVVTLGDGDF
jgi:solute:Na+ symporter, SSS family